MNIVFLKIYLIIGVRYNGEVRIMEKKVVSEVFYGTEATCADYSMVVITYDDGSEEVVYTA